MLTPGYAPIERYSPGEPEGPWTDIYSLGATIYFAFTGAAPDSALDRLNNPVRLTFGGRTVPVTFARALERALAVFPKDRPQDVANVDEDDLGPPWDEARGGITDRLDRGSDDGTWHSAGPGRADRRVRGGARAGRGRVRDHVLGERPAAAPRGGGQGVPAEGLGDAAPRRDGGAALVVVCGPVRVGSGAVRGGGAEAGASESSSHRAGAPCVRDGRDSVHGDGVRGRAEPGGGAEDGGASWGSAGARDP